MNETSSFTAHIKIRAIDKTSTVASGDDVSQLNQIDTNTNASRLPRCTVDDHPISTTELTTLALVGRYDGGNLQQVSNLLKLQDTVLVGIESRPHNL